MPKRLQCNLHTEANWRGDRCTLRNLLKLRTKIKNSPQPQVCNFYYESPQVGNYFCYSTIADLPSSVIGSSLVLDRLKGPDHHKL